MDELTRERYLLGVPYAERYRKPLPLRRMVPIADIATIEERRRVLDEGLGPKKVGPVDNFRAQPVDNPERETSRETSESGGLV